MTLEINWKTGKALQLQKNEALNINFIVKVPASSSLVFLFLCLWRLQPNVVVNSENYLNCKREKSANFGINVRVIIRFDFPFEIKSIEKIKNKYINNWGALLTQAYSEDISEIQNGCCCTVLILFLEAWKWRHIIVHVHMPLRIQIYIIYYQYIRFQEIHSIINHFEILKFVYWLGLISLEHQKNKMVLLITILCFWYWIYILPCIVVNDLSVYTLLIKIKK